MFGSGGRCGRTAPSAFCLCWRSPFLDASGHTPARAGGPSRATRLFSYPAPAYRQRTRYAAPPFIWLATRRAGRAGRGTPTFAFCSGGGSDSRLPLRAAGALLAVVHPAVLHTSILPILHSGSPMLYLFCTACPLPLPLTARFKTRAVCLLCNISSLLLPRPGTFAAVYVTCCTSIRTVWLVLYGRLFVLFKHYVSVG